MSMADRGWRDSTENYADGYVINISGSTATAVNGIDFLQPVALVGITVAVNPSVASGDVVILDGSATADTNPQKWRVVVASAASQVYNCNVMFPRPLALNSGLIVSATTVTGAVSLLYKTRY